MNEIALVTYTNSVCHDVLEIHLSQIEKFAKNFKSYVFTDNLDKILIEKFDNHQFLKYENEKKYYEQYLRCLKSVKENFIIYLQEDFFLYDNVDIERLQTCLDFLKNSEYSYVRLIKTILQGGIHRKELKIKEYPDIQLTNNIYDAYVSDPDSFAFHMQATLWKKSDFISLYDHVKSEKWLESREWDQGMREIKMKGSFYHDYKFNQKYGKYHWQSVIYPHVCTAVGKGKWSLTHHKYLDNILEKILKSYDVDLSIRGTR